MLFRISILVLCMIQLLVCSAEAASQALPGCKETCGEITIPYPFGIGSNCSGHKTYTITCNASFNPPKPFLDSIGLEVLHLSLNGTVRVNNPILSSDCPNTADRLELSLQNTPFSFSDTSNRFTAMGCNNLALISHNGTSVIGGCMSLCNISQGNLTDVTNNCYGIKCCQTRVPPSLKLITAEFRNISENDHGRPCKRAFMVDVDWFSNLEDRYSVETMENVPAVLDYKLLPNCTKFFPSASMPLSIPLYPVTTSSTPMPTPTAITSSSSSSLCSKNSFCSDRGVCTCSEGYEGNPYLPDGCLDVDECASYYTNYCFMNYCVNTPGSYSCSCPPGYELMEDKYGCRWLNVRTKNVRTKNVRTKNVRIIFIGTGIGIGVVLLLVGGWFLYKKLQKRKREMLKQKLFKRNGGLLLQQQLSTGDDGTVEKTKLFTSKDLEKATDRYNENRILGQGGQGTVYKGMLTDGRIVAVKKSKIEDEGKIEHFINEVVILSQINHRNIVKLHGCCLETEVPLLVYEFIPNGTLYQYIHEQNEEFPLSWEIRVRVATEIAGALSYLHSAAAMPIYHRDIKSTNILLDEKYRAKVADFGTSRSIAIEQTHLTTRVQGTFGYLDPEYFQSSQFTHKSDVYSFGVVLVELLTGQKPILSPKEDEYTRSLATHFLMAMEENNLFDMVDPRVSGEVGKEEIVRFANLAKRCLNLDGRRRPAMKEVAIELELIRTTGGSVLPAYNEQKYDEVEYVIDLAEQGSTGPWDTNSTAPESCRNSETSSLETRALLID